MLSSTLDARRGHSVPLRASSTGNHAATMVGDEKAVLQRRNEARGLAHKVESENLGIVASTNAPAYLEQVPAAPEGAILKSDQTGDYTVDVNGMKLRIEQGGMLGISSMSMF